MRYKKITSPSNPLVRGIVKEKKEKAGKYLIIEGRRLVEVAVASDSPIARIFFTEAFKTRHERLLMQLSERSSELIETSEQVLAKLADTETPQGIVALVAYRPPTPAAVSFGTNALIVVCDGIQDPGNLGTIIRTADAAGADAVVLLPGTCDPFSPKGIRATAGSILHLPVLSLGPEALVEWLRRKTVNLIVADVHASATIYEADMTRSLALAFGNEASGVSDYLKRSSDGRVTIPMPGRAESLNVATSAAICLYEAVRQRRGRHSSSRQSR